MQKACVNKAGRFSMQSYSSPQTFLRKNRDSALISSYGTTCFISPCKETGCVYVSFRGTSTPKDLLMGLSAIVKAKHPIMHKGYLGEYIKVHTEIVAAIEQSIRERDVPVVFTGHSAGGAFAAAAAYLTFALNTWDVKCISFGSPKSLSLDTAEFFRDNICHLAVENDLDPIPAIQLHHNLHSLPNKLILKGKHSIDIVSQHSMHCYRRMLSELECDGKKLI